MSAGLDPLIAAYLAFTFVLVVTPGSTTAVVVRQTLVSGRAAGLSAAAGAALGNASHATAAGLGLAVVFARWPLALTLLRYGGAAFLAWLGARSLWRVSHDARTALPLSEGTARLTVARGGFGQGLMVNLLNPAIATFYLVVVPSFMPEQATVWRYIGMAAAHVLMALGCHSAWVLGFDRLRAFFRAPRARVSFEVATGVALLALAARVAWP